MQNETGAPAPPLTRMRSGRTRHSRQSSKISSETQYENGPDVRVLRSMSPGPNEWHPTLDPQFLSAKVGPSSSSGVDSLVEDNGYGQQLADKEELANRVRNNSIDLSHTGAGLTIDETQSRKPSITELSDAEDNRSGAHSPADSTLPYKLDSRPLDHALRAGRVKSLDNVKFLPLDRMNEIITPSSIEKALVECGLGAGHTIGTIARQVWDPVRNAQRGKGKTSRERIFAILVRIQMLPSIVDVIEEGIYDEDLPFDFDDDEDVYRRWTDGQTPRVIKFFQNEDKWDGTKKDMFDKFQVEMTAPYFKLSWKPKKRVHHLTLAPTVVLPFVEETTEDIKSSRYEDFSGGTATVQKVKIHRAHHNYLENPASGNANPSFAIKKLRMSENSAKAEGRKLEYEALAMKRFVDKEHDHLIRLLGTFSHGGYFHMILPCADGNLRNFWETYHHPSSPARDINMAICVARQCLGLARAMKSIHTSPVDASNRQKLDTVFRVKEHGRHGDLKPENILWFKLSDETGNEAHHPLGVLKISDFGFADFHRTHSVNVIGRNAINGITQTYRAPEYDVSNIVSPAYDIWSFGCVISQFVVWYLHGWEGIERFSKRRVAEATNPTYKEDNFFNFHENSRKATEKLSVLQEFQNLREHEACSDFLIDMLDLIQSHLLRMKPKDRASCDEVVRKLEIICSRCEEDPKYCTERVKKIRPISTNLSELETVEYYLPREPGVAPDPINIVETRSIHAQDRMAHENTIRDAETAVSQPSVHGASNGADETTPLINSTMRPKRAAGGGDSGEVSRSNPLVDWVHHLFASCISLKPFRKKRKPTVRQEDTVS